MSPLSPHIEVWTEIPPRVTGVVKSPRAITGAMHTCEADIEMQDGRHFWIRWNTGTRLASVYGDENALLGWTEQQSDGTRQVVLSGGARPPVAFKSGLLSGTVWIEGVKCKAVMSLEGAKRVFGTDRLRLEHRDFKSEVRFLCAPELEIPAMIIAFEVYWSKVTPPDPTTVVALRDALALTIAINLLSSD